MRDHEISQRRACRLVGVDPKTVRRERPPDNPEIREEMKAVAAKRRRFGYRRIGVMLERKGMSMNQKKLYRLYTEEKLGVRPQTSPWLADTDAGGTETGRTLVAGLSVRHIRGIAQVPHSGRER
jgi:hypothetical protein